MARGFLDQIVSTVVKEVVHGLRKEVIDKLLPGKKTRKSPTTKAKTASSRTKATGKAPAKNASSRSTKSGTGASKSKKA